jgi:nucleotide-binding universal stress UspA family protein
MEDSKRIGRILIGTDGSPGAAVAVEEGVRLAQILRKQVIFAAVAAPPPAVLGDPYYQQALTEHLGTMRAALAEATPFADERRVLYETELLEGSAAPELLDLARSRDVDLIVVGSRGLGTVKGILLGSVSTAIVHHADRPVLVVRPASKPAASLRSRMAV